MTAEKTLPKDEYTAKLRQLDNHPDAVKTSSRVDDVDPYGNITTWVIDSYRVEGAVTAFVQRGSADGYTRLVMPPSVVAAMTRQGAGLVTKVRRKTARRVIADRRARGEKLGNPDALKKARRSANGGSR